MIISKLKSFSHANMSNIKECVNNPDIIIERIKNNQDILGRDWEHLEINEPVKYPQNIDLLVKLGQERLDLANKIG